MFTLFLSTLFLQATDPAPQASDASSEVSAATSDAQAEFDADAALAGINAYLNSIDTMRARFLQISPNGAPIHGLLSLARPGRLRPASTRR